MIKIKFFVLAVVFLLIISSFVVLADPPHKDNPGKGGKKKDPPVVDPPVNNSSFVVSWFSYSFGGSLFLVSSDVNGSSNNSSDVDGWGVWSSVWMIWNVLLDPPTVGESKVVRVRW